MLFIGRHIVYIVKVGLIGDNIVLVSRDDIDTRHTSLRVSYVRDRWSCLPMR